MGEITFRVVEKLGFQIDEEIQNVSQTYGVCLDTSTPISDFSQEMIESDIIDTNYDLSEVTYTIRKDDNVIKKDLSEQEVIDFFEKGKYKKY